MSPPPPPTCAVAATGSGDSCPSVGSGPLRRASGGGGITISLDGVGALVPAGRNRDATRAAEKSPSGPATLEVGEVLARGGVAVADKTKKLLQDVTGTVYSGDLCAVMGPSGAGKTTLLDVVSKRKTEGKVLGKVYFDGAVPSTSTVKKYTAYIQQQDCFFGGATVHETILFAAMAKLPKRDEASRAEDLDDKRRRVDEVIKQLNLTRCADTYMGNRLIRGVSGGEMKRTAVACAMLISPRCMFLDEPTSGLDSAMAQEVVMNLRALQRKQGCTFVVTIHQPAPAVFDAFDSLVLLNYGRLAYWGPGRAAPLDFFAEQGFPYRAGYNAAEYLIDTLNTHDKETGGTHDFEKYYEESPLRAANVASVKDANVNGFRELAVESSAHDTKASKFANGNARELWVLLRYKGIPRMKHPIFVVTRLGLYVLLAGLLSSFFYGQDRNIGGILNTTGILFIAVIVPCFMAQVFVEEMKFDREVYTREFNDAYYRAGNYVAQRILVELPMLVVAGGSFAAILYYSVGLADDWERFLFFFLANVVNFAIAMLIGFSIASGISGEVGPAVFLPVFTTLNMLVGGFFIRKATIHVVWKWLYWISFIQWTWSALMVNEFEAGEFYDHCDGGGGGLNGIASTLPLTPSQQRALTFYEAARRNAPCEPLLGDSVLSSFELDGSNKWASLGWSACSLPFFILTFYLGVRCVKHEKR